MKNLFYILIFIVSVQVFGQRTIGKNTRFIGLDTIPSTTAITLDSEGRPSVVDLLAGSDNFQQYGQTSLFPNPGDEKVIYYAQNSNKFYVYTNNFYREVPFVNITNILKTVSDNDELVTNGTVGKRFVITQNGFLRIENLKTRGYSGPIDLTTSDYTLNDVITTEIQQGIVNVSYLLLRKSAFQYLDQPGKRVHISLFGSDAGVNLSSVSKGLLKFTTDHQDLADLDPGFYCFINEGSVYSNETQGAGAKTGFQNIIDIDLSTAGGGTDNQTLSITNDQLSISNGNTITIPSIGTGNQNAQEVPYTANTGLTSTNVGAALDELKTQINTSNNGSILFTTLSLTNPTIDGNIEIIPSLGAGKIVVPISLSAILDLNTAPGQNIDIGLYYGLDGNDLSGGLMLLSSDTQGLFQDTVADERRSSFFDNTAINLRQASGSAVTLDGKVKFTVAYYIINTSSTTITLNGSENIRLDKGEGYSELGAFTNDGSIVTIDATDFADNAGSYQIRYNATDSEGNIAPEVIRTVEVYETHVFALLGQSGMSNALASDASSQALESILFPIGTKQVARGGTNDGQVIDLVDSSGNLIGDMAHADATGYYYHGFEKRFAIDYTSANPYVNICFVPSAFFSTGFTDGRWLQSGDLYQDAVNRTNQVFVDNPNYEFKGIFWNQGEYDAQSLTYQTDSHLFYNNIRTDINQADINTPIVLFETVSRFSENNPEAIPNVVNVVLNTPNLINNTAVVSSRFPSLLERKDSTHANANGNEQRGVRSYPAYLEAVSNATASLSNVPDAPTNLTASFASPNVNLNWDASITANEYDIQYNIDNTGWKSIAPVEADDGTLTTTTDIHTGFTLGATIKYRVAARNSSGVSEYSSTTSVATFNGIYDKWIFGSDNPTHTSSITGNPLTVMGETPTTTANSVTLPTSSANNALVLPYSEANSGEGETWILAVANYEAFNKVLVGTYASDNTGRMLYQNSTSDSMRELHEGTGFNSGTLGITSGGFTIVALSIDTDGTIIHYVKRDSGADTLLTRTGTSVADTGRNIAIGNAYFASSFFNPVTVAGMIYIDRALTETEIVQEVTDFEPELEARGINIH